MVFNRLVILSVPIIALAAAPSWVVAAGQSANLASVPPQSVDMFKAIEDGDIEVKLIPRDSTRATVLVKNKTDKPLTVRMPEVFAGVPVLAQFGGGGMGGGGMGGGGMGGGGMGGQMMGGGMGGGGMGGGGMGGGGMGGGGGGGGFFNVAAEKVGKIRITTICLEHGKPEPRPRMTYEIRPLATVTNNPEVFELCSMLGRGEIDQRAAQVAAWHLENGMSYQELALKHIKHLNGFFEPYFSRNEIYRGMRIVMESQRRAGMRLEKSPGDVQQQFVSPGEEPANN